MTTMTKGALGEVLTGLEVRILGLVADGCADDAVARAMGVAESTIKTRQTILRRKLGARNRANAVHLAHLQGVLPAPPDEPGARGSASGRATGPHPPCGPVATPTSTSRRH